MSSSGQGIMFKGSNSGIEFELTKENVQEKFDALYESTKAFSNFPAVPDELLNSTLNMICDIVPLVENYWGSDSLDDKVKRDEAAQCMLLLAGDYMRKASYGYNSEGATENVVRYTITAVYTLNELYKEGLILSYTTADKFYQLRREARTLERAIGSHELCPAKFSKGFVAFSAGLLSLIMLVVTWIMSGAVSAIIGAIVCFFIMRAVIGSIEAYSA